MTSRSHDYQNELALATSPGSFGGTYKNNGVYFGLAIAEIILGSLMVIFGMVSIGLLAGMYYVGHGIWCGVMVIVAGSIAVGAFRNKSSGMVNITGSIAASPFRNQSSCLMKASRVLTILSSILAGVAGILSIVGAVGQYPHSWYHAAMGINIVVILICAAAVVTSILLSVGACRIVSCCCCSCCCCCAEAKLAGQAVGSGVVNKSSPFGLDSSPPALEPTVAYVYCNGVMTPVDVFTPFGQATRINPSTSNADVHKLGLANPGYISEGGDHAPPSYREL